jgi:hypothetical protein
VKYAELSVSEKLRLDQRNKKRISALLKEDKNNSVALALAQRNAKKRKLSPEQGMKEEGMVRKNIHASNLFLIFSV